VAGVIGLKTLLRKRFDEMRRSSKLFIWTVLTLLVSIVIAVVTREYLTFAICYFLIWSNNLDRKASTLNKLGE
jgi:hypothetical protein